MAEDSQTEKNAAPVMYFYYRRKSIIASSSKFCIQVKGMSLVRVSKDFLLGEIIAGLSFALVTNLPQLAPHERIWVQLIPHGLADPYNMDHRL